MSDTASAFTLRSPEDLLGMMPYLVGYHPVDSLIALLVQADNRVLVTARQDLAAPTDVIVDAVREVAARQDCRSVVVVGYGPLTAISTVKAIADSLSRHLSVTDAFAVSAGHYFCLTCGCRAANGVAFDPAATATAARSTVEGLVALPDRTDLLALADPDPVEQAAASAAIARQPNADDHGLGLLRHLMDRASHQHRLTCDEAARLAVALADRRVHDAAWQATSVHMWQRDLWLDLTRRVPDAYVTGPASLAAWCAWMRGEDTLASAAARRVLAVDPTHQMTRLIAGAVQAHIPSSDIIGTWPPASASTAARGSGVSAVLAVTGDDTVRAALSACADRAGVHLVHHATARAAHADWATADLVLLGVDLATAATRGRLHRAAELVVVSTDPASFAPFEAAAALGAAYIAVMPAAVEWLTDRIRRVGGDPADQLRSAGFRLAYVDRAAAQPSGYVRWSDLSDWPGGNDTALYADLEDVARGECQAEQASTVDRSNYRTLHRLYPEVWTDLVYSNVTGLGAFVADLTPELVGVLAGLRCDYPLLDESDVSELEAEEIDASWSRWVSTEVYGLLGERAQTVWSALKPEMLERLWWDTVRGIDYWPEHNGYEVRWDYDKVVPAFAARLLAEFRRGWRHDPRYEIVRVFLSRRPTGPKFALLYPERREIIATAYSRFEARVKTWQHQAAWRAAITGAESPCAALS